MKKILIIISLLTCVILTQAQVNEYRVYGRTYVKTDSMFILKTDTIRYFYSMEDDTIVSKAYVDSVIALMAGGHDPVTIGASATTAGLSLSPSGQELRYQAASASQNGYLKAIDWSTFYNKLSTVSHNETMTGLGTSASPLKVDTTKVATKYDIDTITFDLGTATGTLDESKIDAAIARDTEIPEISDIAYNATSWDGNTDGATKNAIRDKLESLAGGHDAVTLNATATTGGLSLSTQEISFQEATAAQNGYLTSIDWTRFNKDTAANNEINTSVLWNNNTNILSITDSGGTKSDTITGFVTTEQYATDTAILKSVSKLLLGEVTGRNIDITSAGYIPAYGEGIRVLTDNSIAEGDTISISFNGGTQYDVLGYTSHDEQYITVFYFLGDSWGLAHGNKEATFNSGVNNGDQYLSLDSTDTHYVITVYNDVTRDSVFIPRDSSETDPIFTAWDKDYYDLTNRPTIATNNNTQYLSGTSITWNVANGKNAALTLTGATTITLSNLEDGDTGTIRVVNGGSTGYKITWAGYSYDISSAIHDTGNTVVVSGGTAIDNFNYKYVGGYVSITGSLNMQ